jgi:hypothetical protein
MPNRAVVATAGFEPAGVLPSRLDTWLDRLSAQLNNLDAIARLDSAELAVAR